jgi:hypothetical protein
VRQGLVGLVDGELVRLLDSGIDGTTQVFDPLTEPPGGVGDGTVVELDYELLYLFSIDSTSPWTHQAIRGYNGTTPEPHTASTLIHYSPAFPRQRILTEMHDAIGAFDTNIYRVAQTVVTFPARSNVADLAGAVGRNVLSVSDVQRPVTSGSAVVGIEEPKLELLVDATAFPSGYAVRIYDGYVYGEDTQVNVSYAYRYSADDHPRGGTSLLTPNLLQAIGYRTRASLVSDLEANRLSMGRQGQARLAEEVPPTSLLRLAQYYEVVAQERLSDERSQLAARYPWSGF